MEETALISVIVPVYKVEAYLDRCVQSIVDQTYRNLEIILVDDGSPDNCGAMCDTWAEKDPRIKVIHKENGGGARARNIGMDVSTGDFVGFVDSDDFIHPDMYRYLYRILSETKSDIAECSYHLTEEDVFPLEVIPDEVCVFGAEEALRENIRDQICRQLLWNKLYKRSTIGNIRMVEGKTIDDEFFTYRVLARAHKVAVGKRKLYAYRQQPGSIMHQRYSVKWLGAVEAKVERYLLVQTQFPALMQEAAMNLVFTCLYHGQLAQKYLKSPQKEQTMEYLQKTIGSVRVCVKELSVTHKCWVLLARYSLGLCCKVRNLMNIGV